MLIKPLVSLRFLFALLVFYNHMGLQEDDLEVYKWLYANVFAEAGVGITFFFMLSGFILAYNYQDKLSSGKDNYWSFVAGRIARIFPLHLFTLALSIPLSIYELFKHGGKISEWSLKFLANITLTQSFVPVESFYFSFNGPSWSISDELFFYSLFPAMIYFVLRSSKRTSLTLLFLLIITIPVLTLVIKPESRHFVFYINPLLRIVDFMMGIAMYQVYILLRRFDMSRVNFTILEFSSVALLILFFANHQKIPLVFRYSSYYWVPMFLLVLTFSFQQGRISKLLSTRILVLLGDISFGFYLFHDLIIKYFVLINNRLSIIHNDSIVISCILTITLLCSYFGYIWLEMPAQSYLKKRLITFQFKTKSKLV